MADCRWFGCETPATHTALVKINGRVRFNDPVCAKHGKEIVPHTATVEFLLLEGAA